MEIVMIKKKGCMPCKEFEPMYYAETFNEDYLIIYIYDSELLCYGDLSLRHHQFVYSSISDVNEKLKKYNSHKNYLFTSVNPKDKKFEETRYWRGLVN